MFSIYHFIKVIRCILNGKYEEPEIFSDYVLMHKINLFNKIGIRCYIESHVEESILSSRAVRTEPPVIVIIGWGKMKIRGNGLN